MITIFILAVLLCIAGYYITNQVQGIGYQNQYFQMDKLFAMAKYAYLLSDVSIHDSKMTMHRNQLLETLASQEHISDSDRYYLTELINIDSSDKVLNVSSSIKQMSREYILQLKNDVSILSKQVNFDFKATHKDLKDNIQSLRTRIDEFIEREFNDDKNESENETENS
jgi:hypothetical protein